MLLIYDNKNHYSEITQKLEKLQFILQRDQMKFLFNGFQEEKLDLFFKNLLELKKIPRDSHFKRKQVIKTHNKIVLKEKLLDYYAKISKLHFSPNSDSETFSDKELLHATCLLLESMQSQNEESQTSIYSQQNMFEFETVIVQFEEVVFEQNEAMLLRIRKSIERSTMLENLLEQSNTICEFGKSIWQSINYKNFEDYCLFEFNIGKIESVNCQA